MEDGRNSSREPPESKPPQKMVGSKYEIVGKIREGDVGGVYKVRHRLLDELMVIKVLRRQLAFDDEMLQRFPNEAQNAIRLHHPNIARIHDFAVDAEEGIAFIVMEYIDGLSLEDVIEGSGPPSIPLTVEISRQFLIALGYLHDHGIVHRDVAADNIMVSRDEHGEPLVRLIDVGIAKSESAAGGMTPTGVHGGKYYYSSPEHFGIGSAAAKVERRSDIYSFGALLYRLLTGVLPIRGDTFRSLAAAHVYHEPLPFSETDPEGLVPEGLQRVVLHALAKGLDDRIGSAEEFSQALAKFAATGSHRAELDEIFVAAESRRADVEAPFEPGSTQQLLDEAFRTEDDAATGEGLPEESFAEIPTHGIRSDLVDTSAETGKVAWIVDREIQQGRLDEAAEALADAVRRYGEIDVLVALRERLENRMAAAAQAGVAEEEAPVAEEAAPEAEAAAEAAPEAEVAEEAAPEAAVVAEEATPAAEIVEEAVPEDGVVEEAALEAQLVEEAAPEAALLEEPAPEAAVVEEPAPEAAVAEEQAPEAGFVEETVLEAQLVEEAAPDAGVVEEPAPDAGFFDGATLEAELVEEAAPEAGFVEEAVLEAQLAEEAAPEAEAREEPDPDAWFVDRAVVETEVVEEAALEDEVAEEAAPDAEVVEEPAPDAGFFDGATLEAELVEEAAPENEVIEPAPDDWFVDRAVVETEVVEEAVPEDEVAEEAVPEDEVEEEPAPEAGFFEEAVLEDEVVGETAPNAEVVEEATPDAGFVGETAPDAEVVEEATPDAGFVEEAVLEAEGAEEAAPEDEFVEVATLQDEIAAAQAMAAAAVAKQTVPEPEAAETAKLEAEALFETPLEPSPEPSPATAPPESPSPTEESAEAQSPGIPEEDVVESVEELIAHSASRIERLLGVARYKDAEAALDEMLQDYGPTDSHRELKSRLQSERLRAEESGRQALLADARQHREDGDLKTAAVALRHLLQRAPGYPEARNELRRVEAELAEQTEEEGLAAVEEALPGIEELIAAGRLGKAERELERLRRSHGETAALNELAATCRELEKSERAERRLQQLDRPPGGVAAVSGRVWAAAAVALLIVAAGAIWLSLPDRPERAAPRADATSAEQPPPPADATSAEQPPPLGESSGLLVLTALPWAQLTAVEGAGGSRDLPDEPFTPLILSLPPGEYTLTLVHPSAAQPRQIEVQIGAGATTREMVDFAEVDTEEYFRRLGW